MAEEIKHKFLVQSDAWRGGKPILYRQGYLSTDKNRTVRIRIVGQEAYLTVKGITRGDPTGI